MSQLVQFELEDGETILVELQDGSAGSLEPVSKKKLNGLEAVKSSKTLAQAVDQLRPIASLLKSRLDDIKNPADEVSVKFGVKLSGQAGMILTKVGAETTFEISMTWHKK
ncbi:MAG: CU044_2847 family protein [Cyanobacteria bacterium P01_D01_bin.73]